MEVTSYCNSLTIELTGWKTRINDIVQRLDKLPSGDKTKVLGQVNDLHVLIEELDDRIERLRTQCDTDWEPEKIELETKLTSISNICQDCWEDVSLDTYG